MTICERITFISILILQLIPCAVLAKNPKTPAEMYEYGIERYLYHHDKKWLIKAAEKGEPRALWHRLIYFYPKHMQDVGTIYADLEKIYAQADSALLYKVGLHVGYHPALGYNPEAFGIRQFIDKDMSLKFIRKSAAMGSAEAKNVLAELYFYGGAKRMIPRREENTTVYKIDKYPIEVNVDSAFYFYKEAESFNPDEFLRMSGVNGILDGIMPDYKEIYNKDIAQRACEILFYKEKFIYGGMALFYIMKSVSDYDNMFRYLKEIECHPYFEKSHLSQDVYYELSACYRFGRGVDHDENEADRYMRMGIDERQFKTNEDVIRQEFLNLEH